MSPGRTMSSTFRWSVPWPFGADCVSDDLALMAPTRSDIEMSSCADTASSSGDLPTCFGEKDGVAIGEAERDEDAVADIYLHTDQTSSAGKWCEE